MNKNDVQIIICPTCGFENSTGTKFCRGCGEKLPEIKKEVEVTESSS